MNNTTYYTIDQEKLEEVTRILNRETDPAATEHDVRIHVCGDWPEGDEHQQWLNDADPAEIAEWIAMTVYS